MMAEQLMLYLLGVASPTFPISEKMYTKVQKPMGDYQEQTNIIHSYGGCLFTYQFSHAWFDFRNTQDKEEIDWFENSTKATKANRQYCINQAKTHETYGEDSWGLTPSLSPDGYKVGYGALPCFSNLKEENDGTIAPCGAIGSIVFTPKESIKAMEYYYHQYPKLWGKYGFRDAYQIKNKKAWYSNQYIGIDKGIGMVMIENYLTQSIWHYFMKNEFVKEGMRKIGIQKKARILI